MRQVWVCYLAALRVVWSVREQEGDGLQLAMATIHRHGRVFAAGKQQEVVRRDGDVGAGAAGGGGQGSGVRVRVRVTLDR